MTPFTNKELYMMNGGQKQYVGKDVFWDVYNATPEEETAWQKNLLKLLCRKKAQQKMPLPCKLPLKISPF